LSEGHQPPQGITKEVEETIKRIIGERELVGTAKKVFLAAAIAFAFIEIFYVMGFGAMLYKMIAALGIELPHFYQFPEFLYQKYPAKAVILAIITSMAILLYPISRAKGPYDRVPAYDYIIAALAFIAPLYIVYLYVKYKTVEVAFQGEIGIHHILIVLAILLIIAEATRRALGKILPLIMLVFIVYAFYFAWANPPLGKEGLQVFGRLVKSVISQNQGILGTAFEVMVTYVFMFLFLSSFLDKLGVGRFITDLMLYLFGKRPGGPAKASVVSSALMGTISGSSVANVLTTGTFTIPAMKRAGFPPEVAGAIEPVASTGGQLMPPIMGAAAFIMAEFIGVPYSTIIIAAILPAILYFYSIYVFVDKETRKRGLRGLEELPQVELRKIYYLLPIPLILVALLVLPPQHAAMAGVLATVIVAIIDIPTLSRPAKIGLLLGLAAVFAYMLFVVEGQSGFTAALARSLLATGGLSIIIVVLAAAALKGVKPVARAVVEALEATLKNSIPVFLAASTASVIQSMITFTLLHKTLGDALLAMSMGILPLLLILTGVFSIILGMGVPTTANYIITATILAPTLVGFLVENLGYSDFTAKLSSHMFVFYYGILADITPPVALAAFVGAVLAGADFWKTAINATIFGFAKYILPFIFVFSPILLLVTVDEWNAQNILKLAYTVGAVLLIIHAASTGFTGWANAPVRSKTVRAILVVLALLSVTLHPVPLLLTLIALVAVSVAVRMGRL